MSCRECRKYQSDNVEQVCCTEHGIHDRTRIDGKFPACKAFKQRNYSEEAVAAKMMQKGFYKTDQHDVLLYMQDEKRRAKYSTGYKKLDAAAMPCAGKVTMIPAFTDHGKSVFLRNICVNQYLKYTDRKMLFYSFEDSAEETLIQLARIIHAKKFPERAAIQWRDIENQMCDPRNPVHAEILGIVAQLEERIFCYGEKLTPKILDDHIRAVSESDPELTFVYIDYLQDMGGDNDRDDMYQGIAEVMCRTHDIMQQTGLCGMLAAQYRYDVKHADDKHDIIGLHKVFGSSNLYKKANVFYSLFNETVFNKQFKHQQPEGNIQYLEIDVLKQKRQAYASDLTFELDTNNGIVSESCRVVEYSGGWGKK